MDITWDIEATGLLDESTIDYQSSPYKLKDNYQIHCIVVEDHNTGEIYAFYDGPTYELDGREYRESGLFGDYVLQDYSPIKYHHKPLNAFPLFVKENINGKVVAHNGIRYDHPAVKFYFGLDYAVCPDSWGGKDVEIVDTLVMSKTLNPDRYGGHSLDALSKGLSAQKVDFRPEVNKDNKFKEFAADMLYYCIFDVKSDTKVYKKLQEESEGWDWSDALQLEKSVADVIFRQEHRGFKFNRQLAEQNLKELDSLMEERRAKVEPLIPPKEATKGLQKDFTPPKKQFKGDGTPSALLLKFAKKLGAKVVGDVGEYTFEWGGNSYQLPLPAEPLVVEQPASINDTTHIKGWLVSEFGWEPTEYKDRDLSVDQKKNKLPHDKFVETVDRYVEQTLKSPFCRHRCEFLKVSPERLRTRLIDADRQRPVRVLTNPSLTVGQDKEICPNLERISGDFPYAKDVVQYLTYKHRRNSILGGGLDWEQEEEAEKGYLANVRADGRIPTPADTCGAATSRFKHKSVANIPRVTSLYGDKMRALFGVDDDFIQIGYDFDSLEARIEGHYCWKWERGFEKEYCNALLMEKPHDIHSQTARKISAIIGKEFERGPAKSVKYASTYGATAPKIAKTIGVNLGVGKQVYEAFWDAAQPLKLLRDALKKYWEDTGDKKFILGIDGRKVPTRSPHAILNSLFQSAGVICAKRAMVIHDRMLKKEGLTVDFFEEDWYSANFCQQLIAYHDESQLEVRKSSVKFKMFGSEQEAIDWKKQQENETGKILSDVGHVGDRYYVGYCRAGELAVMAVREAGEYYGLNVELTAGYMLGKNWRDCH